MLLSKTGSNPKTKKSDKLGKYLTAVLHLAPASESGFNVCPMASKGCRVACLNTAGRGRMSLIQNARIKKTRFFVDERQAFLSQLEIEIAAHVRRCKKLGLKPCVRLNGTSDIMWERFGVVQKFPMVQFYDYTKIPIRMDREHKLPKNYHLTFSHSEDNLENVIQVLAEKKNVAVVFNGRFPETFLGYKVIDGTTHDLRFLDPKGVVVALKPLGKAKRDTSGFVKTITIGDNANEENYGRATSAFLQAEQANQQA